MVFVSVIQMVMEFAMKMTIVKTILTIMVTVFAMAVKTHILRLYFMMMVNID